MSNESESPIRLAKKWASGEYTPKDVDDAKSLIVYLDTRELARMLLLESMSNFHEIIDVEILSRSRRCESCR